MALLDNRYMKATGIHGHTESLSKLPMCPNLPRRLQKGEKIKIEEKLWFLPISHLPSSYLSSLFNSQILKETITWKLVIYNSQLLGAHRASSPKLHDGITTGNWVIIWKHQILGDSSQDLEVLWPAPLHSCCEHYFYSTVCLLIYYYC